MGKDTGDFAPEAHVEERTFGMGEVVGSIPIRSTIRHNGSVADKTRMHPAFTRRLTVMRGRYPPDLPDCSLGLMAMTHVS